jgi:lipid A 3-O-deacylase
MHCDLLLRMGGTLITCAFREKLAGVFRLFLLTTLLPWMSIAQADDTGIQPDVVTLDYGTGNETRLTRVNLQWNWDEAWFASNGTHVSGYWDASLGVWNARDWHGIAGDDRTTTDIGITPVFRFESDNRRGWFLDGGVGANVLSRLYENHSRNFSTAFQFGDLIAIGYQSDRWVAGITIEHFSNGAIKHPNPGVNFAICSIGYRFN